MNDPVQLRRYIREVLCFAPKRWFSERMIFDGVQKLGREPLEVAEFQQALQWNTSQNFVESKPDQDAALPGQTAPLLWQISEEGLRKEGLLP